MFVLKREKLSRPLGFSTCYKSLAPAERKFPMPIEPEVGSWYIVIVCEKCKARVVLFRDLTNGQGSLNASYSVTCPYCHHKGDYEAKHYRHASNG